MSNNNSKVFIIKNILNEFVTAQRSYKLAIKKYDEYINTYTGKRFIEVPIEIRPAIVKCIYPKSTLQRKSNEVKVILNWLHNYYKGIDFHYNGNNKNIIRTIAKIRKETTLS